MPVTLLSRVLSDSTGVPEINIFKWLAASAKLVGRYKADHLARKSKRAPGGGRKPRFPSAEAIVGTQLKQRRKNSLVVTKSFAIRRFKEEAKKENPAEFAVTKFDPSMLLSFFRRQGLALRLPSCTKAMSLEQGEVTCRGYHKWFRLLIKDELPDGKKRAVVMDPVGGRFPFDCRANKDEVRQFTPPPHRPPLHPSLRCLSFLARLGEAYP